MTAAPTGDVEIVDDRHEVVIRRIPVGTLDTNCYAVHGHGSRRAVLIDPGGEPQRILNACSDLTVDLIVLTHTHWDHVADAKALKEATGAPLLAHPLAVDPLVNPTSSFGMLPVEVPPVATDDTLDEGDTVTLGGYTFTVMHLPGHDPAHIALVDENKEFFLGGDVLFPAGHGRTDLPGAEQAVMNATLRRLVAELPGTTTVLPGHGAPTTIGAEAPWIRILREP